MHYLLDNDRPTICSKRVAKKLTGVDKDTLRDCTIVLAEAMVLTGEWTRSLYEKAVSSHLPETMLHRYVDCGRQDESSMNVGKKEVTPTMRHV